MAAPVVQESGNRSSTNVNPIVLTINTVQADYVLVVASYNEHTGTAAATVTSVTAPGMTWNMRKRSNGSQTGGLEIWWAHGTSALGTTYNVTINFSGAYDNNSICWAVVTGCANTAAPFDVNATLPAALSGPTTTWTPSFTGISTSSTDDLLLFIDGSVTGGGTAVGFTQLARNSNGGGGWGSISQLDAQSVTALQNNATFTLSAPLTNGYSGTITAGEAIFDALAGNAPVAGGGAQARAMVLA